MNCPCCGQPVNLRDPKTIIGMVDLTRVERRILEALADRFGRWVTANELIGSVYADDPNGGPEEANVSVSIIFKRAQAKLVGTPIAAEGRIGRDGGRRLTWADAA